MTTGFELPKYRGIEEAMQDVKTVARDKGIERCIGLLPSGKRVFDVVGDDEQVELPYQLVDTPDMFIVHGHPRIPAEMSDADILCIVGMGSKGNMAVCSVDETVSWTTGPDPRIDRENPFDVWRVSRYIKSAIQRYGNEVSRVGGSRNWAPEGDEWTVTAHLVNRFFSKDGFLQDYHLREGEKHKEILARWLPQLDLQGE